MTQPQPPLPNTPSPAQLELAAKRFLDGESGGSKYVHRATKEDILCLLEVMIRFGLRSEKLNVGDLDATSAQSTEWAKKMTYDLFSAGNLDDEDDKFLTVDGITRVMD